MIYFDNAATTPLLPCVKEKVVEVLDTFGNPSSIHYEGTKAKRLLESSRETIAECFRCDPDEIIFTSGGSESNALALNFGNSPMYATTIEHHSVLLNYKSIFSVRVDKNGLVDLEAFKKKIKNNGCAVPVASIMMTNNEIGAEEPIAQIARITHEAGKILHTDAVAAVGYRNIDLSKEFLYVDSMSFSGHKFGALKGIGGLFIRQECYDYTNPLIVGGPQENNFRAGTENVIGAVSMACALKYMTDHLEENQDKLSKMMDFLSSEIIESIPGSHINGSKELTNHILNIRFDGVDGETLVLALSVAGICVSSKSACSSGDGSVSHVLKAIGLTNEEASSSIRISLGIQNTIEECKEFVQTLKTLVKTLRVNRKLMRQNYD